VAELAEVHKATASRALNPASSHLVSATTARRVKLAAEQLGFAPNSAARSLRTNRSFTVGVLIPDLTNPLFPPVARGIEDVLSAHDFTALLSNTDNDETKERARFEALAGRQVDGFIIATARRRHPLLEEAYAAGTPVVLVNRCTERRMFPWVAGDDARGVALSVEHLVSLGHRSIAHVGGPSTMSTGITRARAFRDASEGAELTPEQTPVLQGDGYTTDAGERATHELLDRYPGTTAICAGNDLMALGVLRALRARGLRCPQDVSVVGFNDMPFADALAPALTTVRVPHFDLGAEAARILLDLLDQPAGPEPAPARGVLLPVELIVRESTAKVSAAGL
jgi:LacI family transcriptional regulator